MPTGFVLIIWNYYFKRFKCDNGSNGIMFIKRSVFQGNI